MNTNDYIKFFNRTKLDPITGCINWIGRICNQRPMFYINGKSVNAYRTLWMDKYGPLTKDQFLCHTCDNPRCVNLEHLWVGNYQSNNADKIAKGRARYPTEMGHGHRKINLDIAREIRIKYASGEFTTRDLGSEYCLDWSNIRAIVTGKTWKSAGGPIASTEKGHASCKGEKNPNSKLTDLQRQEIISLRNSGYTLQQLMDKFNSPKTTIWRTIKP